MALATVTDALAQYNANLSWHTSQASAELALEAVRFLLVNRAQRMGDQGSTLDYESLKDQLNSLEKFLGATSPRAFGRSRRVRASFCGDSVR
jgi:hypothetical protein